MIVAKQFEGDVLKVASMQHDYYYEAINFIAAECTEVCRLAHLILNIEVRLTWKGPGEFDHRALQFAHDLLAAAWRFRSACWQMDLNFYDVNRDGNELMRGWMAWLEAEVRSWAREEPVLIRNVVEILGNQNQPLGYVAESELSMSLFYRFGDVPWKTDLINTIGAIKKEMASMRGGR